AYQISQYRDSSQNLQGSGSILANTFSFGLSDYMGWTESDHYQGWAFTAARIGAGIARETTLFLLIGGAAQAARAGSGIGLAAFQTLQMIQGGRSGYQIAEGIDRVSNGDKWGYMELAGGVLGGAMAITPFGSFPSFGLGFARQGGFGAIGFNRIPTGPVSQALRGFYLREVESMMFRAKLWVHNRLANIAGGRSVSAGEIAEA